MEMKNAVLKTITVTTLDGGIFLVGRDNEPPIAMKTALAASKMVKLMLLDDTTTETADLLPKEDGSSHGE